MDSVQKLDSLRAQLTALPAGEARARLALELGELLLARGDYGQALVHLGSARDEGGGKLKARIEHATGQALLRRGEPERAEPCFERLLQLARARRDREVEARALLGLGEIYRRRGEAARAAAGLERARAWLEAHPRAELLAAAYTSLAQLAEAAGDREGALELAGDAVDLATGAMAAVEEIAALLIVGQLLSAKRDWAGAEAALARAVDLAATEELPRELAEAQLAYAHLAAADASVGRASAPPPGANRKRGATRARQERRPEPPRPSPSPVGARKGDAPAAWVARAQALFKEHGALADLERVRQAFRAFGRRATDRVAAPAVKQLSDELQAARREVARRAHQLLDALNEGVDRVDGDLPPPARARLHAARAAAVECERGVSAGVAALADAEGRVLAALQSLVIERENVRTLLDQIRALNVIADEQRLYDEACKAAAQLTAADRCVVARLAGGKLEPRAALRVADVAREPAWRPAMQAVIDGAGPMLVPHDPARSGDRGGSVEGEARLGQAMATPLRHGDTLFGAVYVDKALCGGLFGPHELELLSSLCAAVATMLHGARAAGALAALEDGLVLVEDTGALRPLNDAAARLIAGARHLDEAPPLRSILEQPGAARLVRLGGGEAVARLQRISGGGTLLSLTAQPALRALTQALVRRPLRGFADVIGRAPSLRRRVQQAEAAARGEAPLLLLGEPGAGKRLFAEAIHRASPRREGPFVLFACAAVPRARLAQELAAAAALAAGGTLVLDEIGELPPELQRAPVQDLNSAAAPRLIATSSRAPADEALQELPLFARAAIALPPLRARAGDVQLLIDHLLPATAERLGKPVRALAPALVAALAAHAWPGNVRELERRLEEEIARAAAGQTMLTRVPSDLRPAARPPRHAPARQTPTFADMEKELLVRALAERNGSIPDVARQLGVSRGTVYNKLRRFSLDPERFRG